MTTKINYSPNSYRLYTGISAFNLMSSNDSSFYILLYNIMRSYQQLKNQIR